ncbi:hypothetical protein GCM10010495_22970 [Kitasatospora herbaricolor]|nr:hypothetical protein GCM10010495_22970 [Kitasatospora herbaricolor]
MTCSAEAEAGTEVVVADIGGPSRGVGKTAVGGLGVACGLGGVRPGAAYGLGSYGRWPVPGHTAGRSAGPAAPSVDKENLRATTDS